MSIQGIDVSQWQGNIDWGQVKAAGYQFAIIKATEGNGFLDPTFVQNWDGAKAAGLIRFAYHFMRPDLGNTPEAEVQWFESQVNFLEGDGAMLDAESGAGDLCDWCTRWIDGFHQAKGFWPLFYSGLWFMQPHGLVGCQGLANAGLDIAAYVGQMPLPPSPWPVVAFWQDTSSGSVAGIGGNVDLDLFNGDLSQLSAYAKGGSFVAFTDEFNAMVSTIQGIGGQANPGAAYLAALLSTVQSEFNLLADLDNPTGRVATAVEQAIQQELSTQAQAQVDASAVSTAVLNAIKAQIAK